MDVSKGGRRAIMAWAVLFAGAFGVQAGEAVEVPAPWTPVTVKTGKSGTEVGVWGRTHRFAQAALPAGVTACGQELLAAPARLVGQADGQPITWSKGGHWVLEADRARATVCGWQSDGNVAVNTSVRIDYDGMALIGLTVMPQAKRSPKLEGLWLEIPLKRELVSLYHYYPGKWGAASNSGAAPREGMALPFKPFLWLGNEAHGLGWFAESDQGMRPESAERVIEVLPQGTRWCCASGWRIRR